MQQAIDELSTSLAAQRAKKAPRIPDGPDYEAQVYLYLAELQELNDEICHRANTMHALCAELFRLWKPQSQMAQNQETVARSTVPSDDDLDEIISLEAHPRASFFDQLPAIKANDAPDEDTCHICMEHIGSTEDAEPRIQLPCGHIIGQKCIFQWLKTGNSCPICRRVLFQQRAPDSSELDSYLDLRESMAPEEFQDLLLLPQEEPEMQPGLDKEQFQSMGPELAFWIEFFGVTAVQYAQQMRLVQSMHRHAWLTRRGAREIGQLLEQDKMLCKKWADFEPKNQHLMDLHHIERPHGGRFWT